MARIVLHFTGLPPDRRTWFNNIRGGTVPIRAGDWLITQTEHNPSWENWVRSGLALLKEDVPDGIDYLDWESNPPPVVMPPRETPPRRGDYTFYAPGEEHHITPPRRVEDVSPSQLEKVRRAFLPRELSGFAYIDARPDRRGRAPVHALRPPFDSNFLVLLRIAWLQSRPQVEAALKKQHDEWQAYLKFVKECRLLEEAPEPTRALYLPAIEKATAARLKRWDVLRSTGLPHRTTIYRYFRRCGETVHDLDWAILIDFIPRTTVTPSETSA